MGVDPESFARALRFRVAVAELDQELLDTLASRGRLTAEELVAEFDGRTEREERLLASGEVDVWATHRKKIRREILAWLESRRRLGLVVGESGSMTALGASVSHPEWRLTEEGIARLRALSEEQRLIPRALLGRLGQTAVDGLTMAITTATAAVPALLLAWMVGLINDPSPVGFLVAGVFFAAVSIVAAARLRAVRRARTPAQREVERVGQEFAQTLELQAKNVKAESEKALTDAKREHASLTRYLQAVEEYDRRWDATFDAWKREHDAWEQTDPASRGPEPVFPDVGQPPSMPGA